MTNLIKISRLLLVAVFCCLLLPAPSSAQKTGEGNTVILDIPTGNYTAARDNLVINTAPIESAIRRPISQTKADGSKKTNEEIAAEMKAQEDAVNDVKARYGQTPAVEETTKKEVTLPDKSISTNKKAAVSDVTGCSADYGLFSGLITTGGKIFNGLRELIYVVAGFGIIGVSVGGFFGNLNYKWLGAIVISLVIIATTGELINAITGCKTFTTNVISDTLK